jgi:hypothetical protein
MDTDKSEIRWEPVSICVHRSSSVAKFVFCWKPLEIPAHSNNAARFAICGVTMLLVSDDPRPLEYASPGHSGRYGWYRGRIVALIAFIILSLVLVYLVLFEFAQENGPSTGYLLDPTLQIAVAFFIAILSIPWLTLLLHLIGHRFRLRGWQQ